MPGKVKIQSSSPHEVRCLSCNKTFVSPDKRRVRRCSPCKAKENSDVKVYRLDRTAPR